MLLGACVPELSHIAVSLVDPPFPANMYAATA